ncbi:amino acid ABC transporter ATP-binding protein [Microbacterium oxydans]|uniref:amino acid ABC transporter ATP-binding protein n=1 Tax=Microbacterium oxydans TaxID=82380 RepID=UPI0025B66EA5|nr:amino acid ABC transporter ATP-binding protein [Microbacterium oxydans]
MTTTSSGERGSETVLRVRGLRKYYGDHLALDDVDLEVQSSEVVAVLGPSGSGKSTLVRCIDQLETIDGGAMYLDGELLGYEERGGRLRTLRDTDVQRQRRRMGMVFQQFNLFPHWSVLRNITEAPIRVHGVAPAEARERGMELLGRVGLADKADAHPRQLSGGQQQRVAIARAVAARPRILLFDEPTSSLDPELVDEVLQVMMDLAESGMTMIVVTHELEFARNVADRCVFMAEGQVLEVRPSAEFFDDPRSTRLRTFLTRTAAGSRENAATGDLPRTIA